MRCVGVFTLKNNCFYIIIIIITCLPVHTASIGQQNKANRYCKYWAVSKHSLVVSSHSTVPPCTVSLSLRLPLERKGRQAARSEIWLPSFLKKLLHPMLELLQLVRGSPGSDSRRKTAHVRRYDSQQVSLMKLYSIIQHRKYEHMSSFTIAYMKLSFIHPDISAFKYASNVLPKPLTTYG